MDKKMRIRQLILNRIRIFFAAIFWVADPVLPVPLYFI
jgi:hypothetical protein